MSFIKPTMDLNNANQAAYLERAQIQNSTTLGIYHTIDIYQYLRNQ